MDEIPALNADELRAVTVVTDRYAFTWTRGADGASSTTYTAITPATSDRSAEANPPQGGKAP